MNIIEKRKAMPHYDFKLGEKCIVWRAYPYGADVTDIVGETKNHWIAGNGLKYVKTTMNQSGFVGYANAFIEPLNKQNAEFVLRNRLVNVLDDMLRKMPVSSLVHLAAYVGATSELSEENITLIKAFKEGKDEQ